MDTAKIFWSGNSQAIRLPKKFRLTGVEELTIRKEGNQLVLEPVFKEEWPDDFWQAFGKLPKDFERQPQVPTKREDLDI